MTTEYRLPRAESPVLTAPCIGGKRYWKMRLYEYPSNGAWAYTTVTWHDTSSGNKTAPMESEPKFFRQKNLGRSNETSMEEQARKEMAASVTRMLDAGYMGPNGEIGHRAEHGLLKSMQAQTWDQYRMFPNITAVQPKLDGVRCLTDGLRFWSRGGKFFPEDALAHIEINLLKIPEGIIFDGELMMPLPQYGFQHSVSRAKKYYPQDSVLLGYHIFDCYRYDDPQLGFEDRWDNVERCFENGAFNDSVFMVQTDYVNSAREVHRLHEKWMDKGYEGVMLRHLYTPYRPGDRVSTLLKHKIFVGDSSLTGEDEFEIVNVTGGQGKESVAAIFWCITFEGKRFKTRPRGTYAERAIWLKNREKLIGKMLTVRYQNMSDDGVPRFPVGIRIREDLD